MRPWSGHRTLRSHAARIGALALALPALAVVLQPAPAHAAATATVKYATQRMNDAHLNSTQVGSYARGARFTAECWVSGQNVRNDAGRWSTRWYRDSAGWFVPAVDLTASPSSAISGVSGCSKVVSGLRTDTWYTVKANHSGLMVDVKGASTADGTPLQQYHANGGKGQRFRFIPTTDSRSGARFFRIESQLGAGKVWELPGDGDVNGRNGTKADTWGWNAVTSKRADKQWMVVSPSGSLNDVQFRPRNANRRCLDVTDASRSDRARLQIWDCTSGKHQRFTLTPVVPTLRPAGKCEYVVQGGHYVKGTGVRLGLYTIGDWQLPVCGPQPYDARGNPRPGISVGAAGRGVNPYGGAPSTADLDGYQCTELAARWLYHRYGIKYANGAGNYTGGNGDRVVSNYAAAYPSTFRAIPNGSQDKPRPGDVISFAGPHVAVVLKVTIDGSGNGRIVVAEQNAWVGGTDGSTTYGTSSGAGVRSVRGWKVAGAINWLRKR